MAGGDVSAFLGKVSPSRLVMEVAVALLAGAILWAGGAILGILPQTWPLLIGGALLLLAAFAVHRTLRNWIVYRKRMRPRWEKIETIKMGYIHYDPFVRRTNQSEIEGFGYEIFKEIVGSAVRTPLHKKESEWKNVISSLDRGKFDLLVTPLLETFERTRGCDFTAPLFYSNIGLYTSKASADALNIKDETIDAFVDSFTRLDVCHIRIVYIPGEISDKQGRKLYERLKRLPRVHVSMKESDCSISGSLEGLGAFDGNHYFMFCESFFAREIVGLNSVVNILRPGNLLYPVCYAIRNGDYVLRTRLNIGLLEIADKNGGILRKLEDYLVRTERITPEEVKAGAVRSHFVSAWKDPRLQGG